MERVNRLWEHPLYQEHFQRLQQAERHRRFCCHTLSHFLDVARLTYIYSLESEAGIDKEVIYAAALLHDLGRWQQISSGIPHDEASAALAGRLLPECGFDPAEAASIQNAILHHRVKEIPSGSSAFAPKGRSQGEPLALYLRRADKQCRCCFACDASNECNWSDDRKNHQIVL